MARTTAIVILLQFLSTLPSSVDTATDYLVKEGDKVALTCSLAAGVAVVWDIEASGLVLAIDGELQGQASERYTLEVNQDSQILTILSVTFESGGVYRCYQFGSSDSVLFNVSVMVTPEHTLLLISPAVVEQTFYPRCMAFSSNPPAVMSWKLVYPDGQEDFPSSFTSDTIHTNGTTTRSSFAKFTANAAMYGAMLTCDIVISELNYQEQLSDVMYLNVPPDEPYLIGLDPSEPVYAGNNHVIECVANNGRPAAEITWTWDGSSINPDVTDILANENGTYNVVSKVNINRLKPHHNEDHFECLVTNDALKETTEQYITLNGTLIVFYAPHFTVSVDKLDGTIFEGMTVNFDCDIEAHPNVSRVGWLLDGDQVQEDGSHVIDDDWMKPDLHITGVTSEDKGEYQCAAENEIGATKSEKLNLVIFHKPVCKKHQMVRYGVSVGSSVSLECHTEAFPNSPLSYDWSTNSTGWITTPGIAYPDSGDFAMSNFTYTVSSESDFGQISCKASNSVGEMTTPCVLSIEQPGPASAPEVCEASETGSDYIKFFCYEVFRGGSQPFYSLQVATDNLYFEEYFNKTAPVYEMYGLMPETTYSMKVCTSNRDFWREISCSDQFRLTTYNGTVDFSPEEPNPVAAYVPYIAAGVTLVLLIVILILSIVCIQLICKKDKESENRHIDSGSFRDSEVDVESMDLRLQSIAGSSRRSSTGSGSTSSRCSDRKLAKMAGVAVVKSKVKENRRGSSASANTTTSSSSLSSGSEGHSNPAYCNEEEDMADLYDQADGLKGTMRQSTIDHIIQEAEDGSEKDRSSVTGDESLENIKKEVLAEADDRSGEAFKEDTKQEAMVEASDKIGEDRVEDIREEIQAKDNSDVKSETSSNG